MRAIGEPAQTHYRRRGGGEGRCQSPNSPCSTQRCTYVTAGARRPALRRWARLHLKQLAGQIAQDAAKVDPGASACPDGEVGELWVCGPCVASGYYGQPAESQRTFGATLPDRPGERYLRTGDLADVRRSASEELASLPSRWTRIPRLAGFWLTLRWMRRARSECSHLSCG